MEKYIPKSALIAEIEKRRDAALARQHNLESIGQETVLNEMVAHELNRIISFLDTLEVQEEPASEDLAKNPELSGWVARDKDGNLHVFEVKPKRSIDNCEWWDRDYKCSAIDKNAFRDLKWEDEPVCVKLIIIKED